MSLQDAWTDLEAEIANAVRAGVDATLGRMPSKNHKLVVALVNAARAEGREQAAVLMDEQHLDGHNERCGCSHCYVTNMKQSWAKKIRGIK